MTGEKCAADGCEGRTTHPLALYCSKQCKRKAQQQRYRSEKALWDAENAAPDVVRTESAAPLEPIVVDATERGIVLYGSLTWDLAGIDPAVIWAFNDDQTRPRRWAKNPNAKSVKRTPVKKPRRPLWYQDGAGYET